MMKHFPNEESGIRDLFRSLVFKGKRDVSVCLLTLSFTFDSVSQDIRGVFRVCKPPLVSKQYSNIRQYLYNYASGQLSHRQLLALCEVSVFRSLVYTHIYVCDVYYHVACHFM